MPIQMENGITNEELLTDYEKLRQASLKLAEAASQVIREYDGVHRLAKAVSELYNVLSGEYEVN